MLAGLCVCAHWNLSLKNIRPHLFKTFMWQVLYVLLVMDRLDLLGCACVLFSRASVSYYRTATRWLRRRAKLGARKTSRKASTRCSCREAIYYIWWPDLPCIFYSRLVLVFQVRVQGRLGHHSVRLATTLVCCNTNSASYGGSTQSFE